jgi:hypothetical protein
MTHTSKRRLGKGAERRAHALLSCCPNMPRGFRFAQPTYYYHVFGNAQVRLLRNVDDPAKLIQQIEYEAHEDWELNRQRIASDVRMQTFLQGWRAMLPGALEIDVFHEV